MKPFVRTLAAALAVPPETVLDAVILVLEAVRGTARAEDWRRLTLALPEVEPLLHPEARRRGSDAVTGPPPQDRDGFEAAIRDLGIGAYRAGLLMRFTARMLETEVSPIWWQSVRARCPALAVPPGESDAELPELGALEVEARPPLAVPAAWERGELPAWLRAT